MIPWGRILELPWALTAEQIVIARSNTFGFDLLQEVDLRRGGDEPNTILSPLSASMALGMALEGADGDTFSEMQSALGLRGHDPGRHQRLVCRAVGPAPGSGSCGGDRDRQLGLEPAGISLHDQAISTPSPTPSRPWSRSWTSTTPGAKDIINQWVRDQTNGRIEEIVDVIGPLDILFLINTVYFKGDWTTQFKKGNTQPGAFHLEDGSTVTVPMMSGEIENVGSPGCRRADGGGASLWRQAFGMVIVLPAPGETVDDLISGLDDGSLGHLDGALISPETMVQMPKFELEWDGLLNDALKAMGMRRLSTLPGRLLPDDPGRRCPHQRGEAENLHEGG